MPAPKNKQVYYTVKIGNVFHNVTGRARTSKGYVTLTIKDHPNASAEGKIFEHRIVMEMFKGRYLSEEETIHHKNGIKHDNRIDNLEILDRVTHTLLHHVGVKRNQETREKISKATKTRFENKKSHPSYKDIDSELAILVNKGYRAGKIASMLNISRRTVYNKIEYLGLRDIYDK